MSHHWRLAAVVAALFWGESLWGQTPPADAGGVESAAEKGSVRFGAAVNSDAGATASISDDAGSSQIVLQMALIEFDLPKDDGVPAGWIDDLAELPPEWLIESRPTKSGSVQIWRAEAHQEIEKRLGRRGRILSRPQVMTLDGRSARIQLGAQAPPQPRPGRLPTSDVSVDLTVTPWFSEGRFRIEVSREYLKGHPQSDPVNPRIAAHKTLNLVEVGAGQSALLVAAPDSDESSETPTKVWLTLITPHRIVRENPTEPGPTSPGALETAALPSEHANNAGHEPRSQPPAILLKLTLLEIELREYDPSRPEESQWRKELAKLRGSGLEEIRTTPGGPVQIWSTSDLQKSIELMRREDHVRILAEPSLVTHSGRTATFQSGAQVPITVPQENGTTRVEYRDLGVKATATPTYSQGSFRVELHVESNDMTSTAPPAISSRRVQTTVEMKEGQSAIVGGMVQREDRAVKTFVATVTPTLVRGESQFPAVARHVAARDREELVEAAAKDRHAALQLIDELYPEARVQIIPLRKTVIVRGTVAQPEHARQIAEIVSQYFPGALNHLTMKESTPAATPPIVLPAAPSLSQPVAPYPTPAAAAAPKPSRAPDALRELQEEVKLLRRDVNRLIDLLEKRPDSDAGETKPVPDGGAVLLGGRAHPGAKDRDRQESERPLTIEPVGSAELAPAEAVNPPPTSRYISSNRSFVAFADGKDLAETTARAAEAQRGRLAQEWLGQPLPKWSSPCRIDVRTTGAAGGTTTYRFEGGAVTNLHMKLQGPEETLPDLLAHEVMHTVLATHFGRPLPRWADEGIASAVESADHRKKLADSLQESAAANRLRPLRELFDLAEYPQDSDRIQVMHAQGFSLVEFFVRRGGKQTLIRFLKDALANNDWDAALKKHYDFATCDECEKAWRAAAGLEISS